MPLTMAEPPPFLLNLLNPIRYPATFLIAYDTLSQIYQYALQVSAQEDANPLQLAFHLDAITSGALPLLEAIEGDPAATDLEIREWLVTITVALASIAKRLQDFHASLGNR